MDNLKISTFSSEVYPEFQIHRLKCLPDLLDILQMS